ncbi:hypothetical protein AB1L88_15775 [Tautonia sp. JC769]|uniref:hypothetical protein n=1 Tax=Tautonia sp. JC769 TaxID=3232135 RepID=UPI003458093D
MLRAIRRSSVRVIRFEVHLPAIRLTHRVQVGIRYGPRWAMCRLNRRGTALKVGLLALDVRLRWRGTMHAPTDTGPRERESLSRSTA